MLVVMQVRPIYKSNEFLIFQFFYYFIGLGCHMTASKGLSNPYWVNVFGYI